MAFRKLSSVSMTDLFVEELKRMIFSGELAIGEKLPPERKIAEDMGISLSVVHGGITRLTELGLIRAENRKGVYVEDYIRYGTLDTMLELVSYSDRKLNSDIFDLLTDIRLNLETLIICKAAQDRSEEDLERLEDHIDFIGTHTDSRSVATLVSEFFHEISLCCSNPYYAMLFQTFRNSYIFFCKYLLDHGYLTASKIQEDFRGIWDALRKQDEDMIKECVKESVDKLILGYGGQ